MQKTGAALLALWGLLSWTGYASAVGGNVYAWGYNSFGECNVPGGLTDAVDVACGNYFSMALHANGTVATWGDNAFGLRNVPAQATNVIAIGTRGYYAAALRRNGTLVMWGSQDYVPPEATNLVLFAAGGSHTLALRGDGALLAWGANDYGQCNVPPNATNIVSIRAGFTHSMALRKDGQVLVWGENVGGVVNVPAAATNVVAIDCGPSFNLALRADGQVLAWGLDSGGNTAVPSSATNLIAVAAGQSPDFGIRANGTVVAWGRNDNGELNVPGALLPAFCIAAGQIHSLGIRVAGSVLSLRQQPTNRIVTSGDALVFNCPAVGQVPLHYQWRRNGLALPGENSAVLHLANLQAGEDGSFDLVVSNRFATVTSQVAVVTVAPAAPRITLQPAGRGVSIGSGVHLTVEATGTHPLFFQWRKGDTILAGETNATLTLTNATYAQSGSYHAVVSNLMGLASSAVAQIEVVPVFVWGADLAGLLDLPLGLTNVVGLSAGYSHSLALKADGSVLGWGGNAWGEAMPPIAFTDLASVMATFQSSLVLHSNGTLTAWGNTGLPPEEATNIIAMAPGTLLRSDGTVLSPGYTPPEDATNIIAIAAGDYHRLALRRDGVLLAWGANFAGQSTLPDGLTNVIAIAAGGNLSYALEADGTLRTWGRDSLPTPEAATNIVAISAAHDRALAVRDDGRVFVWGNTNSGLDEIPAGLTSPALVTAGGLHNLALQASGQLRWVRPPQAQSVAAGDRLMLGAFAVGAGPITYQWQRNGTNIPGAIRAYYSVTNTQAGSAGEYIVLVTNSQGSLTSSAAMVAVIPIAPIVAQQPASMHVLTGTSTSLVVSAKGTQPIRYQWQRNGVSLLDETNSLLSLSPVQRSQGGDYQVILSNAVGVVTSAVATVFTTDGQYPVLPPAYAMDTGNGGSSVLSSVLRLQEYYGASLLPAHPILIQGLRFRPSATAGHAFTSTVDRLQINLSTLTNAFLGDFARNTGADETVVFTGAITLSSAFRGLPGGPMEFDIEIPFQKPFPYYPAAGGLLVDIRNLSGSSASLVDFSGSWTIPIGRAYTANPEYRQGTPYSGADILQLVATPIQGAPVLLQPPEDQNVTVGDMAVLRVHAAGLGLLTYQWWFQNQPLTGASNATLTISNVLPNLAGDYTVTVSNAFGMITSAPAWIRLTNEGRLVLPRPFLHLDGTPSPTLRDTIRMQSVYGAATFPPAPLLIRELRYRPSTYFGQAFSATLSNLQVNLSTTRMPPDGLINFLPGNTGTNDVMVFSGSLSVTSAYRGPVAGPKEFDIVIPFTRPFVYDPAEGNLLIDVRNGSGSIAPFIDAGDAPGDLASRRFGINLSDFGSRDSGADVVQLVYTSLDLPPRFIADPQDGTVVLGDAARLLSLASGTPPLAYQWYFNNQPLDGGTNAMLVITNAQFHQSGAYWAVVTNPLGAATSQVALLTLTNLGKMVLPPRFETVEAGGGSTTLRGRVRIQNVYGAELFPPEPILIQELRFRPSAVAGGQAFSGAIANVQIQLSTTTVLPDALNANFEANVGADNTVVFSGPLAISSRFLGPPTGPKDFDIIIPLQTPFLYDRYAGPLLIDIRNFTTSGASLIDTSGAGDDLASRNSVGTSIEVATGRPDTGADVVKIIFTSSTNLSPLQIIQQPVSRTAVVGAATTFSVAAVGIPPLAYQWHFQGVPQLGGNRPTLTLTNLTLAEAGNYWVTVSNSVGVLTSAVVQLTVTPAVVSRGPYLQTATTSNILIRWRTDVTIESSVRFGLSASQLDWEVPAVSISNNHAALLTNLLPSERYHYAITGGTNFLAGGPDYSFKTTPTDRKPTRIWVIGDSGTASFGSASPRAVRDAYENFTGPRGTDVWLMLGDNAYQSGTDAEYQLAVFDVYQRLLRGTPLWSTIGNHETYAPLAGGRLSYFDIFSLPTAGEAGGVASGTERYYSFDHANIHFVCLDSMTSDRRPHGPMGAWLQQDLAANTNDWVIAFWHHPPYSRGSHDSDWETELIEMRTYIVPILEAHGVDLVLSGHSHSYERSHLLNGHYGSSGTLTPLMIKNSGGGRPDGNGTYRKSLIEPAENQGAVYVVAGSSGQTSGGPLNHPAMFLSLNRLGSLVIDIDGDRLDAKFLRETGAVDDHFTLLKEGSPDPLRFATIRVANNTVVAQWNSAAGHTYRIERSVALADPDWIPVSNPIIATGPTTAWTGSADASTDAHFFRVVRLSP